MKKLLIGISSAVVSLVFVVALVPLLFVRGGRERDPLNSAYAQTQNICNAIYVFFLEQGRFPNTVRELEDNIDHDPDWNGPYVPNVATDPWDHQYLLKVQGPQFTVICLGEDGRKGGAEGASDISCSGDVTELISKHHMVPVDSSGAVEATKSGDE